jgi:hypothetical protein
MGATSEGLDRFHARADGRKCVIKKQKYVFKISNFTNN